MIESTRKQDERCEILARRHASVEITPPTVEGGPIEADCLDHPNLMHGGQSEGLMRTALYSIDANGRAEPVSGGHTRTTIRSGGR